MSVKCFPNNEESNITSASKARTLNPNASEFVPSSLRLLPGNINNVEARADSPGTSGKVIFNRSVSNLSNNSDDEAHQYWRQQLPDDITPDFKVMGEEDMQITGDFSLSGLSIHDMSEAPSFSVSKSSLSKLHAMAAHERDTIGGDKISIYSELGYSEDQRSPFMNSAIILDNQYVNGDRHVANQREGTHYNGGPSSGFLNDLLNGHAALDNSFFDPVEFLSAQFPGFASESLADVYYANGCDLNLTLEILTQLELQVDGGFDQNPVSKTTSAPSFSALDFPSLQISDVQNNLSKYPGEDLQRSPNTHQSVDKENLPFLKYSPSGLPRGAQDFASAVRKFASQDSGHWKYERNGSTDRGVGSSRSSVNQASPYGVHEKSVFANKMQNSGAVRTTPVWLETGDSVGSLYSESREEARDFARLRNACFEQARQAYLIGNKALAKELSLKGKLYSIQMTAAHDKARESIYRQRNPVAPDIQSYIRGQDPLIDLHGLHVSEAIHVLKHELNVLRRTARSAGQRLQVLICVGTGHHTKGSRTPARLPVAVEQYLLDERVQYTEPQPGLLRIVIH